ncbi:MAG TPA: hypothetical protein VK957_18895 [Lunatimonas sp.]|nr:hypothetical protein [Lunatimonas sp.]
MKIFLLTLFGLYAFMTFTAAQINFSKVGLGLAYWERSYTGPDERVILPSYPGEEKQFTAGSFLPTLNAELALGESFALEGKIGMWNKTYTGTETVLEVSRREVMSQRIIPVAAFLNYYLPALLDERVRVFAGIGINRFFIQNEVERFVTGQEGSISGITFDGNDYGALFKIGAEKVLSENLNIAFEGILNTGTYIQNYTPELGATTTKYVISLAGLSLGAVLKYSFLGNKY